MTGPQVLVRETEEERKRALTPSPDMGWFLLGVAGVVFALVGFFDIALAWYPANFGSAEFEFASFSQSMNFLPLPVLGLLLVLAGGVARGIRWVPRTVAILLVVVVALIAVGAVLWATTVPVGLKAVDDQLVLRGLKKAIAKTAVQATVYPIALLYVSVKAWRHASAATRKSP